MSSAAEEPEPQQRGQAEEPIVRVLNESTSSNHKVSAQPHKQPPSDLICTPEIPHTRRSFIRAGHISNQLRRDADTDSLAVILNERMMLLKLALRLLGSSYDAEDVVQETYVRWYTLPEYIQRRIQSPTAWLVRVATRICLDQLSSTRVQREKYIGQSLPDSLPGPSWHRGRATYTCTDPADQVSLNESVIVGVSVILDSVTLAERIPFILHDIFGVPFNEIAKTTGRTPTACRQLATSARRRIRTATPRRSGSVRHRHVASAFKYACETGKLDQLIDLLKANAVAHSDRRQWVRTARNPIAGADRTAQSLTGGLRKEPRICTREERLDGQPCMVARIDGVPALRISVSLDVAGRIDRQRAMTHPQ
ncbi:sigma-70 family RNA polymerase sigma factor [Streptomyces sp. NPDC101209]|uniref:sigma-70 family RNA polymerase sigma factor n=1 Tax=Streptomyces sp. NPDC101209 TaxID=3366129 RepID=UPI00381070F4